MSSTRSLPKKSPNNNSLNRSAANGELRPATDVVEYVRTYAREKPDVAALWCFGIGFVLGWKIKPW